MMKYETNLPVPRGNTSYDLDLGGCTASFVVVNFILEQLVVSNGIHAPSIKLIDSRSFFVFVSFFVPPRLLPVAFVHRDVSETSNCVRVITTGCVCVHQGQRGSVVEAADNERRRIRWLPLSLRRYCG